MTVSIQEKNKQVVRDYFEKYWNNKDIDGAAKLIQPDYNWHLDGGMKKGLEGWRMEDGKFAEHWDVMDAMSIFKQIGGTDVDAVDVMYAASIEE